VRIGVAITLVVTLSAGEQTQSANPSASPEACCEWIEAAIARARRVNATPIVGAEKDAGASLLSQHHQRVPPVVIEEHQAARFADQIDLVRLQPSYDLRGLTPCGIDQASNVRLRQRNSQIPAAVTATGAAKSQVAETARHGPSLPHFASPRCSRDKPGKMPPNSPVAAGAFSC